MSRKDVAGIHMVRFGYRLIPVHRSDLGRLIIGHLRSGKVGT
jgi:hypothetical protein